MKARDKEESSIVDEAKKSTMSELAKLTQESEKIIVF